MYGLDENLDAPVDVLNHRLGTLLVVNSSPGLLHRSNGPIGLLLVFEDCGMLALDAVRCGRTY